MEEREARIALMGLIERIRGYQPWTDKETWEKRQILRFMEANADCLLRTNQIAHVTASAWIVNAARTRTIMAYHRIYDSWAWLGGHADGEGDLLQVALREVQEEAGLPPQAVRPVSADIFSLETLTVDGHVKHGSWVPSHLHLNMTYLLEADEAVPLRQKDDENRGVAWFTFDEALKASSEDWFVTHVYQKLIRKVRLQHW